MAQLAQRVMAEANDAFRTADELAAAMKPHLLKQVSNSAIYQYTNARTVAPGDVLLAAALAAGLSLDEELGTVRQANEIEILRAQVTEMREEMASLRAMMAGGDRAPAKPPMTGDVGAAAADRASRRRAWAERSRAADSPGAPGTLRRTRRSAGR